VLTDELRAALVGVVARAAELGDTFEQEVQARRAASVGERLVSTSARPTKPRPPEPSSG